MSFRDSAQGLLGGLGRFSNAVSGLLYPGFNTAGVDPRQTQAAKAQAMMQMGAGLLGGANFGQAYGAGAQAGYEPIEQARRQSVLDADAQWRRMQTERYQQEMEQQRAKAAEQERVRAAMAGVQFDPENPQGYAMGIAQSVAPLQPGLALDAIKTAQGFAPKQQDLPEGMMYGDQGQIVPVPGYEQMRARIAAAGRAPAAPSEGGKPPSGYRWTATGLEPIPGGPADPTIPQRTNLTPKDASAARQKLNQIAVARQQLALAKQKYAGLQNSFAMGPGGQFIPTPAGKEFDAAIDSMRGSITAITRVPGVGAMSDFETRLDQAKFPTRGNYESVAGQQLQSLDNLLSGLEQGYQGMLGFENPAAPEQPAAAPAKAVQKAPMKGQIVKGYRFKGGDPANPENWEKAQ